MITQITRTITPISHDIVSFARICQKWDKATLYAHYFDD